MTRKEWREVATQSLYFLLAAAAMALLVATAGLLQAEPFSGEKAVIMLGLWLLVFSMFLGLSPFAMDGKQRGLEYLLTLPLSRRRLLFIKLLPRLAGVVLFYLGFVLAYVLQGDAAFGGGFAFFSLAYFALFFISFSLSVIHENFIVQSIWAGIALCGYLGLCLFIVMLGFSWKFRMPAAWVGSNIWHNLSYDIPTLLAAIAVFLIMASPFVVSIFLAFKKFDLKPARAFNRRQLLIFVPLLLLAFAVSLGVTYAVQSRSPYWESRLFILKGRKLLKADFPGKLTLFAAAGRQRVDTKGAIFWDRLLLEQGTSLYLSGYDTKDGARIIGRLDQSGQSWKTLYRSPERHFVINDEMGIRFDGRQFVYLMGNREELESPGRGSGQLGRSSALELVRVELASGSGTAIRFNSSIISSSKHPWFIGSGEQGGKRFWLACLQWRSVVRLWEDGSVEDLGPTRGLPFYAGGLLFVPGDRSLIVRRIDGGGGEEMREIEGRFDLPNPFFNSLHLEGRAGGIYAMRGQRLVRIDLGDLAVKDVGPAHGHVWAVPPGDFYYVEFESWPGRNTDQWKKLYRLRDGRMEFLKQFDFGAAGYGHVIVNEIGVILQQTRMKNGETAKWSVRAYAFPDLAELKFKDLE